MKKTDHVILFCEKLLAFMDRYPYDFDTYMFHAFPSPRMITPFSRDDRLNNPVVQEMRNRFGKAIMKKIYLLDWEFVNVISYDSFFIEHLNIVDNYYDTIYNILWEDIIYTPFYVPTFMVKFKTQKHLYLRKKQTSV